MKHSCTGRTVFLSVSLVLAGGIATAAGAPPVLLQHRGVQDPAYQTTAYSLLVPKAWRLDGSVSCLPAPSLARTMVIAIRITTDNRGGDVICRDNPNYSPNADPRFNNQDWAECRR